MTDPATEELVGDVPAGAAREVNAAVAAAGRAFDGWRWLSANERADLLHTAATKTAQAADDLIELLIREQGKPLPSRPRSWSGARTACATTPSSAATAAAGSCPAASRAPSSTSC